MEMKQTHTQHQYSRLQERMKKAFSNFHYGEQKKRTDKVKRWGRVRILHAERERERERQKIEYKKRQPAKIVHLHSCRTFFCQAPRLTTKKAERIRKWRIKNKNSWVYKPILVLASQYKNLHKVHFILLEMNENIEKSERNTSCTQFFQQLLS